MLAHLRPAAYHPILRLTVVLVPPLSCPFSCPKFYVYSFFTMEDGLFLSYLLSLLIIDKLVIIDKLDQRVLA